MIKLAKSLARINNKNEIDIQTADMCIEILKEIYKNNYK